MKPSLSIFLTIVFTLMITSQGVTILPYTLHRWDMNSKLLFPALTFDFDNILLYTPEGEIPIYFRHKDTKHSLTDLKFETEEPYIGSKKSIVTLKYKKGKRVYENRLEFLDIDKYSLFLVALEYNDINVPGKDFSELKLLSFDKYSVYPDRLVKKGGWFGKKKENLSWDNLDGVRFGRDCRLEEDDMRMDVTGYFEKSLYYPRRCLVAFTFKIEDREYEVVLDKEIKKAAAICFDKLHEIYVVDRKLREKEHHEAEEKEDHEAEEKEDELRYLL
jgi:hypothetical protein